MIAGTKFKLKVTILAFSTTFTPKKVFAVKKRKVNTTIDFCIFELV